MRSFRSWVLPAVVVTGGLLVVGALIIYQAISGGGMLAPPREKPTVSSSTPSGQQVLHADEATFAGLVLDSKVPVLVDFYAEWCGPCQELAPVLKELAAETPDAKIVKVDVDRNPSLATKYSVDAIPSLKLFKNGEVTDGLVGLASKDQLRAMLTR